MKRVAFLYYIIRKSIIKIVKTYNLSMINNTSFVYAFASALFQESLLKVTKGLIFIDIFIYSLRQNTKYISTNMLYQLDTSNIHFNIEKL
jgi:hypothetical protein